MPYAKYHRRSGHILLMAIGVYLLLTAAYTGYVVHREKADWVAELDRDLSKAARTIPFILEPGFFERSARPGAISEEEDLRNIDRLTRMAEALGLAYLYTLSDVDGTVYITSSSASAEERESGVEVRAFTPYPELAEEARATMVAGTPHFRSYTDRWGTFRHVYIPMKTPQGIPYILAADQSTEALAVRLKPLIIRELLGPLFFVLVAIPFFLMYRIQLYKHARHLQHVNREVAEAKERLETATEAGGIGIWDRDIVKDRLVWDERMHQIYGIRNEDFGGTYEAWQQSVHPEDLDRAKAEMNAAEQGEKEFDTQFRIIRPDGEIRHIHAFANVIFDKKGNPIRVIGTNQDITERKKAEEALKVSEEQFRSTVNDLQVGVVVHNADTSIEFSNPRAQELLGLSSGQIAGKTAVDPAWSFVHTDLSVMKPEAYPVSQVQKTGEKDTDLTLGIRHPDRERIIWVLCSAVPVFSEDGELKRIIVNFMDITERKEAEKKIKESEKKLRNIIENSTNMFYSHTPDQMLTYVSPQVKDILGYEVEDALTRWTEMVAEHPANERVMKLTEEAIRTGQAQPTYECVFQHKDGHPVWVEVREGPLVENGETTAVVGSLNDITERKQLEEELAKHRADLEEKVDERTEELRTIVNAMAGREVRMAELKEEIADLKSQLEIALGKSYE